MENNNVWFNPQEVWGNNWRETALNISLDFFAEYEDDENYLKNSKIGD